MSFIKKLITLKIKPDNNFGRILNKTSRYFAIFGGFILLIAALISICSIFGRVVFLSPILGDFELVEIACAVAIGSFLPVIASFFLLTICCFYTFILKVYDILGN